MRVGVRVNRAAALADVWPHLPPGLRPARNPLVDCLFSVIVGGASATARPGVRQLNLLYEDHVRMARTRDLDAVLDTLASRLRLFIAERARGRVFVHAGVVGWRGRAILVPGRSMAGKSTLVAELVRAGATYYSDEFAVLDARGRVHPFAKPLSLRADGETQQTHVAIAEFGGRAGVKPLPVGLVLATEYKAGARWRPRRLTQGQGMLALLAHVVTARTAPAPALTALQRVAETAQVFAGRRGDARAFAQTLLAGLA